MPAEHGDQIVEGYLARLEAALGDVPSAQRADIVAETRRRIDGSLARETDAELLRLLDDIGQPAVLAAEARSRYSARATKVAAPSAAGRNVVPDRRPGGR